MLPSSSLEHALYCFDANSPHLAISASCFFSCPLFNGMHFSEGVPTGLQSDEIFSVTMLNMNQNINPDTYVCLQFVEHPVLFGRFRHAHLGGKNVTSWHVQPETIQCGALTTWQKSSLGVLSLSHAHQSRPKSATSLSLLSVPPWFGGGLCWPI